MCVIIYKPAGVKMPSKVELEAAFRCNPNGCGFVSSEGYNYKGLSLSGLIRELKKVGIEEDCIIHFRLATNGSVKKSNCHPFENNGVWFAHNGILSIDTRGDMTDSETAFRDILSPVADRFGISSPQMHNAVSAVIGYSKFAFMKDGRVALYGRFEKHKGCWYSNTRHFSYMAMSRDMSWEEYLASRPRA